MVCVDAEGSLDRLRGVALQWEDGPPRAGTYAIEAVASEAGGAVSLRSAVATPGEGKLSAEPSSQTIHARYTFANPPSPFVAALLPPRTPRCEPRNQAAAQRRGHGADPSPA